jgi:hypothetical protein
MTTREKLEGLAHGFLNILDGTASCCEGFDLYRDNNCINSDVLLHEFFYKTNDEGVKMKVRLTRCATGPKELFGSMWGFQPVDMRKKYFVCIHCKKEHLVKDYLMVLHDS